MLAYPNAKLPHPKALATEATTAWTQAKKETSVSLKAKRWQSNQPNRYTNELNIRTEISTLALSDDLVLVFWQREPFIEHAYQIRQNI